MTQHKSRRVHVQIVRLQSHENHVECFYREALLGTKQIAELLPVATHIYIYIYSFLIHCIFRYYILYIIFNLLYNIFPCFICFPIYILYVLFDLIHIIYYLF